MNTESPWHIPVVLRYPEQPPVLVPIVFLTSSKMLYTVLNGLKQGGHLEGYCAMLLRQVAINQASAQSTIIMPFLNHDDDKMLIMNTLAKTGDIIRIHSGVPDKVFESQRNSALEPHYSLTVDFGENGNAVLFTYSERITAGLKRMREDGHIPIWITGILTELQQPDAIGVDYECLGDTTPMYITQAETDEQHKLLHLTTEDALLLS